VFTCQRVIIVVDAIAESVLVKLRIMTIVKNALVSVKGLVFTPREYETDLRHMHALHEKF
jgi:hypothetical protein